MPGFSNVGTWFPFTVSPVMQFLIGAEASEEAGSNFFAKLIESHCRRWLRRKLSVFSIFGLHTCCHPWISAGETLISGVSCLIPAYRSVWGCNEHRAHKHRLLIRERRTQWVVWGPFIFLNKLYCSPSGKELTAGRDGFRNRCLS